MSSILRTISHYQQIQLEKKGATVTDALITASDEALWHTLSPYQRKQLEKLGQVALSGDDGGGGYVAKAVRASSFSDGMFQAVVTIPDSHVVSSVTWMRISASVLAGNEFNFFACGNDVPVVNLGVGQRNDGGPYALIEPVDYTQAEINRDDGANSVDGDTWTAIFMAIDSQARITQCYVGDTLVTLVPEQFSDFGSGFDIPWSADTGSQKGFQIPRVNGSVEQGLGFDISETWITTSNLIDWSVQSNRRKFLSVVGKPVDLGANGETPFGYSPQIFFNWKTMQNLGTCGDFTLGGSLPDATTSPSD